MKILVTNVGIPLQSELAQRLAANHEVRCTAVEERHVEGDFVCCDLGHGDPTNDLVRGMDAIVHGGATDASRSVQQQLDDATRRTYNLLYAASQEKVPRILFLSSLALMAQYGEDFMVTETWRPTPTADADQLCYHLGEFTCKEFVRQNRITIVCLRLGEIFRGGDETPSSSGLHLDDAVRAVVSGLAWDVTRERTSGGRPPAPDAKGWGLFHVQSPVPNARFSTLSARNLMDFEPEQAS